MSRLTKKDKNGYQVKGDNPNTSIAMDISNAIQKLGQLEDIEEELGIDLHTLFKALKNGIYYKYKVRSGEYRISECRKCYLTGVGTLVVDYHTYKYLYDYGKTWALTKEELL